MNFANFVNEFLSPEVFKTYLPSIVSGTLVTLEVAVLTIITGLIGGLLLASIRAYRNRFLSFFIVVFADLFRALPPLAALLIIFFGLPSVGVNLSPFATLWLVLSAVLAAFSEEIFWAGIVSIKKGQWDAARATGLGFTQALFFVILPQAIRLTIPPLTNRTIAITKNSALGTVIGVPEILSQATAAQSFSASGTPLIMGALAYLTIFIPLVLVARVIEKRYQWRRS